MPEPVPADAELPDDLLEAAAERLIGVAPDERTRVLDELVREHPQHHAPLRRLAGDLAGTERLLGSGFAGDAENLRAIGPYRVIAVIGEGAFGVVYLCAQHTPMRRQVAVKVLRPGAGDRHTLARFEAERHVLATLNHPAIAQVYDAGALPDGRPYFVMEYVRGLPITTYCDQHRLPVDARLALFVRLCQGAHHAHAQGIVHRDFKPANVLVFEQDGQPQPKVIDFGIAKAVHPTAGTPEPRTETGRVIGTPGYMSPEQLAGTGGDLDARADVFSLGVMCYELLTGELPWGRRPATNDSDPPRPSARVATDATGDVARHRGSQPRKLVSRLRGDLDWIVLKALARERERRYGSAQELADDVQRHLRGDPVVARPPSVGYRLRKLVRRQRTALVAAGAVAGAAVLGLWASLAFRAEAQTWAADVEAAASSLLARAQHQDVLAAPNSQELRKALVQDALGFYDKLLRERPTAVALRTGRARALATLGKVHWLLGEQARAESAAKEAVAEAEALLALAPDNLTYRGILGAALGNVGRAARAVARDDDARAAFSRAVRELERCHAGAPGRYADALVRALLDWASSRTLAEAQACADGLRRAITLQEATVRERPSAQARLDLLEGLIALANVATTTSNMREAAQTIGRAEDLLAATPEAGPGQTCGVLRASAILAGHQGDLPTAIRRMEEAIAVADAWAQREPSWQEPRKRLLEMRGILVRMYSGLGDVGAVTVASRAAVADAEDLAARFPEDPLGKGELAAQLGQLATALLPLGRRSILAEGEQWARRAIALADAVPPAVELRTRLRARWLFLCHLGVVLDARGSADAPAHWEVAHEAVDSFRTRFGILADELPAFVEAELRVARQRIDAGRDEGARVVLDQVEAELGEQRAAERLGSLAAELHRLRALLASRQGDDVVAADHADRARAADAAWPGTLAGAEAMRAAWQAARSGSAADRTRAEGHRERAIELHEAALDALRPLVALPPQNLCLAARLGQAQVSLAELLLDRGERDAAQALLAEALPALAELRDEVHADVWNEKVYALGQALAAR